VQGPQRDDEVPAFWQALGLPGLVDLHVHFMPDRVMDKVWAFFDGVDWPIAYREPAAARVERLAALGVRAHPALCYPHKPGMAQWLNAWAAGFAAATPACVHSATFFPEPGVDAYVAEALEAGARVFKAHLEVGGYDPRDPLLRPVWRRLAAAGVPVVVHCGNGPSPGAFTGPGPIGEVLDGAPELVAVVAHMGMPEYRAFWELAMRHPNVALDTTMAFTHFSERLGAPFPRDLVEELGAHPGRVVLGTDFPNIPHPYAHQLDALARLDLGDDWLRAVVHDNGARLLAL
jgi:uncharacterized protein